MHLAWTLKKLQNIATHKGACWLHDSGRWSLCSEKYFSGVYMVDHSAYRWVHKCCSMSYSVWDRIRMFLTNCWSVWFLAMQLAQCFRHSTCLGYIWGSPCWCPQIVLPYAIEIFFERRNQGNSLFHVSLFLTLGAETTVPNVQILNFNTFCTRVCK